MFWSQAVVDGEKRRIDRFGDVHAELVMGLKIAKNEPSSVKVDDHRAGFAIGALVIKADAIR